MVIYDTHKDFKVVDCIKPASQSGTVTGNTVDQGQTCSSMNFVLIAYGAVTGAPNVIIEDSNDEITWSEVDKSLIRGEFEYPDTADGGTSNIGYVGYKRYVRMTINGATGDFGVVCVLTYLRETV